MAEQIYTYRDSTFNLDQAYYYTLLLQIDATSFSYAIVYKQQLLAWDTNCGLNELFDPQELHDQLLATYRKVVFGLPANGFSLVPHSLFSAGHTAGFARLLDVKPNEKVLAQVLDDQNHIVYKVDEELISATTKFDLKNAVFSAKGWIKAIANENPPDNNIYLNIDNQVEFLYFKNGKIRFYNAFDFKNAEDLLYYAALVTKEVGLLPESTALILSGNIPDEDNTVKHLAEFFATVSLNQIQLLDLPSEIAPHQILELIALSLCESSEAL
jgi:hypothetical protein